MDFYEELGISPRASEDEIRRSYKRLTLLLHPDQHQVPELRALAEAQMKRINEMVAILTDADKRRAYDEKLQKTPAIVRQRPLASFGWLRNNRGWLLVVAALLIFVAFALVIPRFDDEPSITKATANPAANPQAKPLPSTPAPAPAVRVPGPGSAERHQSVAVSQIVPRPRPKAPGATTLAADTGPWLPKATITAVPATGSDPAPQIITPLSPTPNLNDPVPQAATTLEGRWVYAADPNDIGDAKFYPAVYVELSISSVSGQLRGVYRSRYKVPDRALSPVVNFSFEGPRDETSFLWRGESGAKGEITLRLESGDTLKIHWFATEMGSTLSLGSGGATLHRF
jgi:hypothetical protein